MKTTTQTPLDEDDDRRHQTKTLTHKPSDKDDMTQTPLEKDRAQTASIS